MLSEFRRSFGQIRQTYLLLFLILSRAHLTCFHFRAHINRMKEKEGAEVVDECPEEPATDGASSLVAGLLLLPLLVVHHL